jgi:two-component system CheB/CheR fusion protein
VNDLGPQTLEERLEHARRELETAYEELQSTVEELEATNEELWSASEELETVSEELRERTEEALHANALLDSVLSGNARAAIVVDEELRVVEVLEGGGSVDGADGAMLLLAT